MTLTPNNIVPQGIGDGVFVELDCPTQPQRLSVYFYGPPGSSAQLGGVRSTDDAGVTAVTAGRALQPFDASSPVLKLSTGAGHFQRQNGTIAIEKAGPVKTFVHDALLESRNPTPACELRGTVVRAG